MTPLSFDTVCQAMSGRWIRQGQGGQISGVTIDTRTAKPGELFIAVRGERFDGHEFLSQAAASGCPAAIVDERWPVDAELTERFAGGVIVVNDAVEALGRLAAHYRKSLKAFVIAVTGSNGKTTVKRMIHHILSSRMRGSCSPKSFNNNVGVPLTLLAANIDDEYVICEVGTNAPGEIAALSAIARPNVGVITTVAPAHLEKLGSVEGVAVEKASMLGYLQAARWAVLNGDSAELAAAAGKYNVLTIRFGKAPGSNLRLSDYAPAGLSCRYRVNDSSWFDLPSPGRHNAMNATAAIAVATLFNVTVDQAGQALADFVPADGRLQRIDCGSVTLIHDAYNANPSSVQAAAETLAGLPARRRVMILGDMRELGPSAKQWHEQTGQMIGRNGIDLVIAVGPLGRYIADGARSAGVAAVAMDSVQQAGREVAKLLAPGDCVLVKGSRTMAMEGMIEPIRAFAKTAPHGRKD